MCITQQHSFLLCTPSLLYFCSVYNLNLMFIVYRLINHTKKEVYHGITQDLHQRLNSSHCVGVTKALSHWKCGVDKITVQKLSNHYKQPNASEVAHYYEESYRSRKGYRNIRTAGK